MSTVQDTLDPVAFRRRCRETAVVIEDEQELANHVLSLRDQFDPDISKVHTAAYAPPLALARRLYLRIGDTASGEVMLAVQTLEGERFISGIAAVLSDVAKAMDHRLLGWLCLQFDLAHRLRQGRRIVQEAAQPIDDADNDEARGDDYNCADISTVQQASVDQRWSLLRVQFDRVVRRWTGDRRIPEWQEAMIGYLESSPASLLPPVDMVAAGTPPAAIEDLPLLRKMLEVPQSWWHSVGLLRQLLNRTTQPFVRALIESRIEAAGDDESDGATAALNSLVVPAAAAAEAFDLKLDELLDPEDDPVTMTPPPPPPPPPEPEPEEIIAVPRRRRRRFAWLRKAAAPSVLVPALVVALLIAAAVYAFIALRVWEKFK